MTTPGQGATVPVGTHFLTLRDLSNVRSVDMAEYDVVIRGGTIVDGTGIPPFRADLAIKDGRVAMISGRIKAGGAREIDAKGCNARCYRPAHTL